MAKQRAFGIRDRVLGRDNTRDTPAREHRCQRVVHGYDREHLVHHIARQRWHASHRRIVIVHTPSIDAAMPILTHDAMMPSIIQSRPITQDIIHAVSNFV
nr:hypothetical protein [Candidatus Sigynarchaeum springense]MDO8118464.1 hypothetical protein [Candidatus Sigynarchaeota archaeon]